MRSPSPCPRENTLLDLVEGRLDAGRTRRIAGHLERCLPCQDLAGEVARATVPAAPESVPDAPPPGTVPGRYQVIGRLGAGATSVVHAAVDMVLGRKVALKLPRPDPAQDPARAQAISALLLHEARILERLCHPHVVAVHDAGTPGGTAFLAMELVEGGTLGGWLRAGSRPVPEVLAAVAKAGEGLHAAHAAGIVHRDFKPENVLIGARGQIVLADFGLAQEAGDAGSSAPAGTPAYMAPEQLAGEPAGPWSDQFSFCVTLHRALCGEPPFVAGDLRGLARAVARGAVREPPPGRRLPARVRSAIRRGLDPCPDRRWPSMRALLDEIAVATEGEQDFDGRMRLRSA